MISNLLHFARSAVVKLRKSNAVLSAHRMSNYDLVYVIEFIPVFIFFIGISVQWFEFGTTRNSHIEGLGGVERLLVEQMIIVFVCCIAQQLVGQSMEVRHDSERQLPEAVRRPIHHFGILEGHMVIEPVENMIVLTFVQLHLDRVKRLDVENIVSVVQRRLFIIERRKPHTLEVFSVSLLPPHHDPHSTPLSPVDRLDYFGRLVYEGNGTCNVIKRLNIAHLLPGHRHVLQKLEDCMRDVLESPEIHSLVLPESFRRHVSVVLYDFSQDLRWQHLFLAIGEPKLLPIFKFAGIVLRPLLLLLC